MIKKESNRQLTKTLHNDLQMIQISMVLVILEITSNARSMKRFIMYNHELNQTLVPLTWQKIMSFAHNCVPRSFEGIVMSRHRIWEVTETVFVGVTSIVDSSGPNILRASATILLKWRRYPKSKKIFRKSDFIAILWYTCFTIIELL